MTIQQLIAVTLAAMCGVSAHAAGAMSSVHNSCHASLSVADAKLLAASTPNARAFTENLHAALSTEVARQTANGTVAVRVVAHIPARGLQQVGIYTVNLSSGHILDDDQEPAEDHETATTRERLIAKHCH